jgi:hypothetical protein
MAQLQATVVTGSLYVSGSDANVHELTVGRGSGNIVSNTVLGNNALDNNTTGTRNAAVGYIALQANTTGVDNTALGFRALKSKLGLESQKIESLKVQRIIKKDEVNYT